MESITNVQIATVIMAAIGTATTVLFGVWRIAAHYENRNDNAHGELRGTIDKMNEKNDNAHGELRGDIKGLVSSVNDMKVTLTSVGKDVQYLRRDVDGKMAARPATEQQEA